MKVRKAIIPAAGLGTRFLPATKAQPKEMLPIVDKPTIQYIVEEAVASGIEDIIIISGRGKRAIEDHFDRSLELEEALEQNEKYEELEQIKLISELANIHYIRQKEPKGLGHAIWCARKFIGQEPFAVLLGDDIVQSSIPCLKQLLNVFEEHQSSIIGYQQVKPEEVSKYGIITPRRKISSHLLEFSELIEKPSIENSPSNFAIMGRYILTPRIFDILNEIKPGKGGEIQLTDAINALNRFEQVFAFEFEGTRHDVGDKFGFIKATIDMALERNDISPHLIKYIAELYENLILINKK